MPNSLPKVLPVMFKVRGQPIPAKLTMSQRATFVRGLGVAPAEATVLGLQDGTASLLVKLQDLIERTADETAIALSNSLVERWNSECSELLGAAGD